MAALIGPKPKFSLREDGPVEGDACVFHIEMEMPAGQKIVDASALLGPGRDYLDMEAAKTGLVNVDNDGVKIVSTLHGPYSTITALLAEFPEATLDGTAKRLLAVERARDAYAAEVAAWELAIEAAGLEPCDRCGGHGGWKGWPGYTCYECGGRGTQAREKVAS